MAAPAKKSAQKSKALNGPTSKKPPVILNGPWTTTSSASNSAPQTASSSSGQTKKIAAQTKPPSQSNHFRLLDLPAELRKIVFDFYMEGARKAKQNIVVVEHKPNSKYHNRPELYQIKPDQDYKKKDKNRRRWDPKTKTFVSPPPSPIALLFSAKQMHQEALPSLYGNGIFVFRTFRELSIILPMLGDGAKYLHSIEIDQGGYIKSWVGKLVSTLKVAKSLKKLTLSHNDVCRNQRFARPKKSASKHITARMLMLDFLPLLKVLHTSYQAQHPKWSILDTIKIREDGGQQYWGRWCNCSEKELKNETFQAELRKLIAEDLGVQEN
ncbi:hypothetical protein HII31_06924 [Pseudocercospora fuligena]|uniref:Uncharacterized protein n=1 Tax=Pseudocercospora fuligena TaxID=685502 RepID=A0A8H6VKZ0_9PEZI|nr:hypothetical protein HII31_06924 [Pseudocercospora fuligena]